LQGWSCCDKRVIDFDDFLKISGCTVGRHTKVKIEPPKPVSSSASSNESMPAPSMIKSNGTEIYGTPTPVTPVPAIASQPKQKPEIREEDLNDPADAVIIMNASCKRKACKATYNGPESSQEECVFHSGTPIFHEGSKGWTCCSRKVLEFDEFLKIAGCKRGKHRFLDVKVCNPQINLLFFIINQIYV
jgi:hypothetical protein